MELIRKYVNVFRNINIIKQNNKEKKHHNVKTIDILDKIHFKIVVFVNIFIAKFRGKLIGKILHDYQKILYKNGVMPNCKRTF